MKDRIKEQTLDGVTTIDESQMVGMATAQGKRNSLMIIEQ